MNNIVNGFANSVVNTFNAGDAKISALVSGAWNAAPNLVRAPLSAAGGFALSTIAKVGAGFDSVGIPATAFAATHQVVILTTLKVVGTLATVYAIVKLAQVCLKLGSRAVNALGEAVSNRVYGSRDQEIEGLKTQVETLTRERNDANALVETRTAERDTARGDRDYAMSLQSETRADFDHQIRLHDIAKAQVGILTNERDATIQELNATKAQVGTLTHERDAAAQKLAAANVKLGAINAQLDPENAADAEGKLAAIGALFAPAAPQPEGV